MNQEAKRNDNSHVFLRSTSGKELREELEARTFMRT
jgi:hypothetical protein